MIARALARMGGGEARATLRAPGQLLWEALTGSSGPSFSGATVNETTAMRNVSVYACVRVLSTSAASLPLIVYRRVGGFGRERVEKGVIVDLLSRPCPTMTTSNFVSRVMADLNLWGNAFVGKIRAGSQVSRLVVLAPQDATVWVNEDGEPRYRFATIAGQEFGRRDILHIKSLSTDGVLGLSPIQQARQAIGLGMTMEEYAARWFSNGAHPSGVIQVPGELTTQQVRDFVSTWNAMHSSAANAHRPAVLEGGATWQSISDNPEDSQLIEQRKFSTTDICRIFGVQPWMIFADSGGSSMTYANVEQESLSFVTHSLRPWLVTIEDAFKADEDLFPLGGSLYPEFLIDALLRADSSTRSSIYAQSLGGRAWRTVNEVRRLENEDAIEGGDTIADAPAAAMAAPSTPAAA